MLAQRLVVDAEEPAMSSCGMPNPAMVFTVRR